MENFVSPIAIHIAKVVGYGLIIVAWGIAMVAGAHLYSAAKSLRKH